MGAEKKLDLNGFGSKAVHSGTNHIGDAVNTPIFQSSTYKFTDERYAGWAAGAQHTLLYARLSSVNSDAVAQKFTALEGGEDAEVICFWNGSNFYHTDVFPQQATTLSPPPMSMAERTVCSPKNFHDLELKQQ